MSKTGSAGADVVHGTGEKDLWRIDVDGDGFRDGRRVRPEGVVGGGDGQGRRTFLEFPVPRVEGTEMIFSRTPRWGNSSADTTWVRVPWESVTTASGGRSRNRGT